MLMVETIRHDGKDLGYDVQEASNQRGSVLLRPVLSELEVDCGR
jgi:hypothetical protein